VLVALWLLGGVSSTLRAQFVISEFMASNGSSLVDEDGQSSDWIELHNAGGASASLAGWYLTDDPSWLTKWVFPEVNVSAQGYLVVFASGKDRTNDVAWLHTNFSLDAAGEYLALVRPDGVTVAYDFAPSYPPQERDYSYGESQVVTTNVLVASGSAVRYWVPEDGVLGRDWTGAGFNDAGWLSGAFGLGYETSVPGFSVRNFQAATTVGDLATAEQVIANTALQQWVVAENAGVINYFGSAQDGHYGNNLTFPGHTVGADYEDFVVEATGVLTIPSAGLWTFGVNSDDGFGLLLTNRVSGVGFVLEYPAPRGPADSLGVFNVPAAGDYELRLVYYERGGGSCVEFFAAPGSFDAWSEPDFDLVGDTVNGGLVVRSDVVSGTGLGYGPYTSTDVDEVLRGQNGSIYCRVQVAPTEVTPKAMVLRVRYDDGFVAYLNGQEVAGRNAPGAPVWDSRATMDRSTGEAVQVESINLSDYVSLLAGSGDVLALQGLNHGVSDPDFLLEAELVEYDSSGTGMRYFATPTPGGVNESGFAAFVADTRFTVDRGFFEQPFDVEVTTDTAGATIYYTLDGTEPLPTNGSVYGGPLTVSTTTTLRAVAYLEGYEPSDVDTQTYIFLEDVIRQSPDGSAPAGWPSSWGANIVNYGMDPNIVDDPRWSGQIKSALTNLPTFSIVMKLDDLFDPSTGIYANPGQDGALWERPCSVELVNPDGSDGFQINAGIRIRGGFSRSTDNPKHALRLFFRSEYGSPKLRYPLFGDEGTDTFDNVDLRTFQNYSWSFQGDSRGIFVRDQINRDLQLAMGHQGERGEFYHLYINGQYWGIYNTCERPEASYGATYYGGMKEDYDVIKVEAGPYTINATDGNMTAWTQLYNLTKAGLATDAAYEFVQGNNPDGTRNPSYANLVDVDNMIDYMLIILYGGNLDAPISNFLGNNRPNNWYGIRNRTDQYGGFRFFVHDAEHTLLDVNQDRTGPWSAGDSSVIYSNPQWIWQGMQKNAEFRLRVADHVHRHFFNGGVLTSEAVQARFLARTGELDPAVVAESARWGDSKREPALNRDNWLSTVNSVANSYIPQRSTVVLNQLRADGLYPALAAPVFSQHGGNIESGYMLTMDGTAGTIYYTVDGSDPRLRGGAISSTAQGYRGGVRLNRSTTIKARALNGNEWSALNEASFVVIQTWTDLYVTELMYHPAAGGSVLDPDEFEFIELKNVGSETLDLSGVGFASGVEYAFPVGTELASGDFVVLVSNPEAFASRYPGVSYDGVYTGRLNNGGEVVSLVHAAGGLIYSVAYGDALPWPPAADGAGFSLVPVNPNVNPDPNNSTNWRASSAVMGSPGRDDPSVNILPVRITEVLTHTDLPQVDSIELYNPNDVDVDISYWYLTDDRAVPGKFRVPAGTFIGRGGYVVFNEGDFNPTPGLGNSFNLSSHGEEVWLYSAGAGGELTGFSDGFSFGAAANGVSFGRYTISSGAVRYPAQAANSLGAANVGPRVGPVVINEIQYHPALGDTEFVELKNITGAVVPLYDVDYPTNTWRLEGVDFAFPQGASIPANGLALVVEGDPVVFRSKYGVPAGVAIYGPFAGLLQNNGEKLELSRPDHPDVETNGVVIVPMIAVDTVRYDDLPPWPAGADGQGPSLERIQSALYGDEPLNWRASPGESSPGLDNTGNRRPLVFAGADQELLSVVFPLAVSLSGEASDDGEPAPGNLTLGWTQVGGAGVVWFENAGAANTLAHLPGAGTYVLRLTASDGLLTTSDDVVVTVLREAGPATFIPAGSVWRYWDQGALPSPDWTSRRYDDAAWASGAAQLGYGDGDETTVVGFGPNSGSKYITTWFRHTFDLEAANQVQSMDLGVLRDDGAVVYVNGVEVFRSNMPVSVVDETTLATTAMGGTEETTFHMAAVDPALLVSGANVVAVEVHQANVTSSDLSFDLELVAEALPDNVGPSVDAGPDQQVEFGVPVQLEGAVADDGLPVAPGYVAYGWVQTGGAVPAVLDDPNRLGPVVQFSEPGVYIFELRADDGELSVADSVMISVSGSGYDAWLAAYFTAEELLDPATSGPDADPDGDGLSNAEEYTAGTVPTDAASVLAIEGLVLETGGDGNLRVIFTARAGRGYTVEARDGMDGVVWQRLVDVPAGIVDQAVQVVVPGPVGAEPRFYRVVTPIQP
jgi:hypothetical protein